jgi:hypothetical protein
VLVSGLNQILLLRFHVCNSRAGCLEESGISVLGFDLGIKCLFRKGLAKNAAAVRLTDEFQLAGPFATFL